MFTLSAFAPFFRWPTKRSRNADFSHCCCCVCTASSVLISQTATKDENKLAGWLAVASTVDYRYVRFVYNAYSFAFCVEHTQKCERKIKLAHEHRRRRRIGRIERKCSKHPNIYALFNWIFAECARVCGCVDVNIVNARLCVLCVQCTCCTICIVR